MKASPNIDFSDSEDVDYVPMDKSDTDEASNDELNYYCQAIISPFFIH